MRGSQDTKEKLDALGVANTLEVVPGAALAVPLDPAKLFDRLDQRRPKNAGFKSQPYILLSHQAGSNRAEYAPIAPRLVKPGFNCLAIDQRSGGEAVLA
jgi:hypothetical protein